jgi:hypothetical protein
MRRGLGKRLELPAPADVLVQHGGEASTASPGSSMALLTSLDLKAARSGYGPQNWEEQGEPQSHSL